MVGEGVSRSMIIPPKQNAWQSDGFCLEECLKEVGEFYRPFLRNFEQISEVVFQISVKSNHILHDSASLSFSLDKIWLFCNQIGLQLQHGRSHFRLLI